MKIEVHELNYLENRAGLMIRETRVSGPFEFMQWLCSGENVYAVFQREDGTFGMARMEKIKTLKSRRSPRITK